ncbi:MAG: cooK1 [candidate division NC10 bacterium]|nr:cooK1 [candidate division NC10 bacterium]
MSGWWEFGFALLIWPGLIGGTALGWLLVWIQRKLAGRLQGRKGPPFYQPFFDFVKLLGKEAVVPGGVNRRLLFALPLISAAAAVCALSLIPVPGNPMPSFAGDLIVLLYLMEMPALCEVLAGYSSRSLYGQVGSSREAILWLAYNLPFLAAVLSLAIQAKSLTLAALVAVPFGPVHLAAVTAFLFALPGHLKRNPFSIPNAEQEIVAGPFTEFSGVPLACFELSHGLELVALVSLFAVLFLPVGRAPAIGWLVYLVGSGMTGRPQRAHG